MIGVLAWDLGRKRRKLEERPLLRMHSSRGLTPTTYLVSIYINNRANNYQLKKLTNKIIKKRIE
jgi:hypothetical protein